ncbi:Polyphenol oxidase 1 [Hyphodiscus hymeniophilus]|uniref:Polyphenol oxidase 1 n=1 Tax=Hyphodiscus hymeniophilus TaxID=353542 RepID=A0A9P7AYC7_9HELO|nr:Polyphenol oxidase 1 [Hyphodiscus hymeniophilus]
MVFNLVQLLLALFISCLGLATAEPDVSKNAAYSYYAITGVHTGVDPTTGSRQARQPIQVMQKSYPMIFDLYIQSLIAMQSASTSDRASWYQYAGIHGRPYIPWDNVQQGKGTPLIGYCTHGSVLFPTWHRPLLAGLEQILAGHAQSIAATYPLSVRSQYQTAATNFRLPYWDWATNATIPDVVSSQHVTVNTPTGSQTLTNPLWGYKFPPLTSAQFPSTQQSNAGDWYLAADGQTYRSPNNQVGGPSNVNTANTALTNSGLQYSTYYALTKAASYNNFATQSNWGPSIESVHGNVHVAVGGNYGHMTQLSYAGFDPIFYLHHCNVDRIVALYQAMNPNNFLTSSYEYGGTFTIPPSKPYGIGPNDTITTLLGPFSTNTNGDQWTSASSQYLSTFGYSYPEIKDWIKGQTPAQLAQNVTAQVNMMWSGQSTPSKRSITVNGRQQVIEWSVALSIERFQLNGTSFVVRLFVDNVPADPQTWALSQSCVGSFAVLPQHTVPDGPLADVRAYDEISLVQALRNMGHDGQDVPAVVQYLTQNFQWRVQLMDGTVIPPHRYPSLEVEVQEEKVTLARDIYELPTYGQKTLHPEITQGKAGV